MASRVHGNWLFPTLACLALTSCAPLQVKLGWKVYLAKTSVISINAKLPNGPAIGPGQKLPLVVSVAQPNGKVLLTQGKGGGKVSWADLRITSNVVSVNQKGIVSLARDPRISDGKIGHVTVTVPSHPDIRSDLDIPFRYDIAFKANFSGASGSSGMSGTDGMSGTSGSMGSTDPNNASPGGDGGNGSDGSNGGDGGPGGDALPVQVRVAYQAPLVEGGLPLLQIRVSSPAKEQF